MVYIKVYKSPEEKEAEHLKRVERVLEDMVEDGEAERNEHGEYRLTEYGVRVAKEKMRMGRIASFIDILKMTKRDLDKQKKKSDMAKKDREK